MTRRKSIIILVGFLLFLILLGVLLYYLLRTVEDDQLENNQSSDFSLSFDPKCFMTADSLVKHRYYALSYNEKYEQPDFVVYLLTTDMLNPNSTVQRSNDFRPDPLIETRSAGLDDYRSSGFDRGHLCPAGDMSFSMDAMSESFYMSNMSPQVPSFNRGIWKKLETWVRSVAFRKDSLIVYTGPVLNIGVDTVIGSNRVGVPKKYFKAIYSLRERRGIAFLLENEKSQKSIKDYILSIDSLETVINIDLFSELPDSIEDLVEKTSEFDNW